MILRAGREELPRLTALWQTCFGDRPEEIEVFWKIFGKTVDVFCAKEGKDIAAMVCALPAQLVDESGESHPAAYLYAVATAPAYRRRGLCGKVLAFAEAALRKEGVSYALLVPSEPPLFDLYRRYGYRTVAFRGAEKIFSAPCAGTVQEIDAEAYFNLRELLLYENFLSCGPDFLRYQAIDDRLCRIETAQQVFCAVCAQEDGLLTVKELLPYDPAAAALLLQASGAQRGVCLTPEGRLPYAMGKALRGDALPQNLYFGLAMD